MRIDEYNIMKRSRVNKRKFIESNDKYEKKLSIAETMAIGDIIVDYIIDDVDNITKDERIFIENTLVMELLELKALVFNNNEVNKFNCMHIKDELQEILDYLKSNNNNTEYLFNNVCILYQKMQNGIKKFPMRYDKNVWYSNTLTVVNKIIIILFYNTYIMNAGYSLKCTEFIIGELEDLIKERQLLSECVGNYFKVNELNKFRRHKNKSERIKNENNIIKDLLANNFTQCEIARNIGRSQSFVSKRVEKYNLKD